MDSKSAENKSDGPPVTGLDKVVTRKVTKKRTVNKRKKQNGFVDDDLEWQEKIKKRLNLSKKSGNGGSNNEKSLDQDEFSVPVVRWVNDESTKFEVAKIVHPDSYDRVMKRVEDCQLSKPQRPPANGHVIDSHYICALCQQKSSERSLGDLFGPYYVKLDAARSSFWPPYLKKPQRLNANSELYTDLWLHGYCALWTPGILAKGNVLTGLEQSLEDFWQQKCVICQIVGASIGCFVKGCKKAYHFICAEQAGCVLKEETLRLYCQIHKKLSTH